MSLRLLPSLFAAATLGFAGFTAWRYFAVLFSGVASVALLMITALIAAGSGRAAMRLIGLKGLPESEANLTGATLGLGLIALGTLGLAAVGALTPLAMAVFLGALWVWGFGEMRAGFSSWLPDVGSDAAERGAWVLIGLILLVLLWLCFVPPHQYDSLVYHLPLPAAYIRAGRLVNVEHLVFAHFPQNAEMLFTTALLIGDDLLAQMYCWLATALSLWWLFEGGRRVAPRPAVVLGCLLLATQTAVMLLASTTYVEPFVMLWVTAGVFSFHRFWDEGKQGWLVIAGIFTGLALGTKYYAGISAIVLGVLMLWRVATSKRPGALRETVLFTAVTTVVFLPWLVKNAIMIGNPVFPFLYKWFPNTGIGWEAESAERYFRIIVEYGHSGGFWKAVISLPTLLLRNSLRFGGGMDVLGDLGWDLSFWALPLAAWAAFRKKAPRLLLVYFTGYFILWFFTGVILRFLAVTAPVLCLLGACGLYELWRTVGRLGKGALAGGVGLLSVTHVLLFLFVHSVFQSHVVAVGMETREDFLARRLQYYPCAAAGAEVMAPEDKILIVGEQRAYYLDRDHIASTVNAPNRFIWWANEAESPAALAGKMAAEGITHLMMVPSEADRIGSSLGVMTDKGKANWAGLERDHLTSALERRTCSIFKLTGGGR